jgi:sugar phosphate isomerase/epimerase
MNILLHTIALEPARWTPQRVSRPLVELLPHIAKAGFRDIEIFEPHLTVETASHEIKNALAAHNLTPVILSSYLNLNPAVTSDAVADEKIAQIVERVAFYGFKKLRLFPGPQMNPADNAGVEIFKSRVQRLAARLPGTEILLETHDGSLADDPAVITRIVKDLALPKVGLLFQATFFQERESIMEQFRLEKPFIRHLHLQNRMPDLSFVGMREGIIPWPEILAELADTVDATLEFVPVGICQPEQFDLAATIQQAIDEAGYVRGLASAAR